MYEKKESNIFVYLSVGNEINMNMNMNRRKIGGTYKLHIEIY